MYRKRYHVVQDFSTQVYCCFGSYSVYMHFWVNIYFVHIDWRQTYPEVYPYENFRHKMYVNIYPLAYLIPKPEPIHSVFCPLIYSEAWTFGVRTSWGPSSSGGHDRPSCSVATGPQAQVHWATSTLFACRASCYL
jgi:hypothetical protein